MIGGTRPPRRRLRLPLRMAWRFGAAGLVLAALTAAVALWVVRRGLEQQLIAEVLDTRDAVPRLVEQQGAVLRGRLDELAAHLTRAEPLLLERLILADPAVAGAALDLAARFDLDRLELLDSRGRVLSSWLGATRAGLVDPALASAEPGGVRLIGVRSEGSSAIVVVSAHDVDVGSHALRLVGSVELDQAFLERAARGHAAALLRATDGKAMRVAGGWPELGATPAGTATADAVQRLRAVDGSTWLAADRQLGDGVGRLAVAAELGSIERTLAQMRLAFVLLTAGVGALAGLAGLLIARRVTRPVDGLVRAVDAIAAGEADYTFRSPSGDVFDELVDSFSRLHRSLEVQRRRSIAAERVAAWREVARHVAHEVKNPLAPIRLTVQNLTRVRREAPQRFEGMFEEGMRTILEEVEQLSRMVGEFSEFARLPAPALEEVDLERLIDRVVELYGAQRGLRVVRRFAGGLPPLSLDPDQISRALKNVIGNAVEAMRSSSVAGTMTLEVGTAAGEGIVRVEVADNGPGFSEETARRVFEPYFTTKSSGTGLGMAITHRIVSEHGGWIAAENRPDGGARIVIHLPIAAAPAARHVEREDRR